jgi:hypothetical protein
MKYILILILALGVSACASQKMTQAEIAKILIGKWQEKESADKNSFSFMRSNEIKANIKSLHFREDGKVEMYFPFGCQMPPFFKTSIAKWRMLGTDRIEIDHLYPESEPEKWQIVKLNRTEFRFVYE